MERMTVDSSELLTRHQVEVMSRVLREEEARREHVVVYLSGAHAYGFPSPDSDLDLKAIHVADTAALLGLDPPTPTVDRAEIIEDVGIGERNDRPEPLLSTRHVRCDDGER